MKLPAKFLTVMAAITALASVPTQLQACDHYQMSSQGKPTTDWVVTVDTP
jgi:hypothetical protein